MSKRTVTNIQLWMALPAFVRKPRRDASNTRPMNSRRQREIFDAWLRDHAALLHHVAQGFATGADRHDLMQELMLALWRAVPAFRAASRPSTFIFRVTHNAALTWKRAEKGHRRRVDALQESVTPLAPAAPAAETPSELELL